MLYDIPSKYETRNGFADTSHRSNYHYGANGNNFDSAKYATLDPKYQTAPFTSRPGGSQSHSHRSQLASPTHDTLESKTTKTIVSNSMYVDPRRLPTELESVQERSIEQSEMTYKGSIFNESVRLMGEEGLKYKIEGDSERDVKANLNFSTEHNRSKGTIKYNTFSSGFGLDHSRDYDMPNIKSPTTMNRTYESHHSGRSRNLSDSIEKRHLIGSSSVDDLKNAKDANWSRRNRNEKDKLIGAGIGGVGSFDPGAKPQQREISKTLGTRNEYEKDFGIAYNPSKQGERKLAAESRHTQPKPAGEASKFIGDTNETRNLIKRYNASLESRNKEREAPTRYDNESVQRPKDIDDAMQQIQRLESKLKVKTKLVETMTGQQEELWLRFQSVQQELFSLKSEQEGKGKDQTEKLLQKVKGLEETEARLLRENEELRKAEKEASRKNQEMSAQIQTLQNENLGLAKKYQSKIESLMSKIKQIELSSQSLQDPELMQHLEGYTTQIKTLENQNVELQKKNEVLAKIIREKDKKIQKTEQKLEESVRHIIDERVNQTLHETSRNYSHKLQKYKNVIKELTAENENLKADLRTRPSQRQHRETEAKLRNLEYELQEERNNSRETKRSPEIENYKKIANDLKNELDVHSSAELVPRVRELLTSQKTSTKFTTALTDMVTKCAPPGYFGGKPALKESWKFIKKIMEEYMNLKKQFGEGNPERAFIRV